MKNCHVSAVIFSTFSYQDICIFLFCICLAVQSISEFNLILIGMHLFTKSRCVFSGWLFKIRRKGVLPKWNSLSVCKDTQLCLWYCCEIERVSCTLNAFQALVNDGYFQSRFLACFNIQRISFVYPEFWVPSLALKTERCFNLFWSHCWY